MVAQPITNPGTPTSIIDRTPVLSESASTSSDSMTVSNVSKSPGDITIPEHWRPEVELCIQEKSISDSSRAEIVRTLVNLLFARASKPTKYQCEELARKLILKFPFMRDDMGNGYVSDSYYRYYVHYDVYV